MSELDSLIHRYLEDSANLSAGDLTALIAALKADPELALTLREQLMIDDLLAQKLALDRRNFVAQVEQRVADCERGDVELNQQVADLRSMAAAERLHISGWFHNTWKYYAAVAAVALVGVSLYVYGAFRDREPTIATVTAVEGEVTIHQDGESVVAERDEALENGQTIVVPGGGSVTLAFTDGSEIRVKGHSSVVIGAEPPATENLVRIERGELVATVKQQSMLPMKIATPHALASTRAGLFRLVVSDENTLLDVSEGKVQLDRLSDNRSLPVVANESGLASRDTLQLRQLTWPDRRDGLAYLISPLETGPEDGKPLMVARSPETRKLQTSSLELRGDAALRESRLIYELNGGSLISPQAGSDIFAINSGGSELTLEAVFSPASLEQAGPARIVALADEDDGPDFALAQDGTDVMFSLRTNVEKSAAPSRLPIASADAPMHLTMTYRSGELISYRDGMEIARSKDLWGSLATWRPGPLTVGSDASGEHSWRGILEAFALYNRCLEPGEVARNARNYRLLARREM